MTNWVLTRKPNKPDLPGSTPGFPSIWLPIIDLDTQAIMAKPRLLNRQVANEANSPLSFFMPVFGGRIRLSHKDNLLVNRSAGLTYKALEIYIDLLSDSRLQTVLAKQFGEITSRPIIIEPGHARGEEPTPVDIDAAHFCEDVLMSLQEPIVDEFLESAVLTGDHSFDTLTKSLLLAIVTHISPAECVWRRNEKGRAVIDRAIMVDPRRFTYEQEPDTGLIFPKLVTRTNAVFGEELPPRKFIFHRHWNVYGADQLGFAYGPALYWLIEWKREALTFWLSILDRYADPALIGTKPRNASDKDESDFYNSLQNFSRETNMVIPEGFSVDTLKTSVQGSAELLQGLVNYCDSEVNLLLTGEDTTGQKGGGSQARDTVSNSIRIMMAKSWSDELNLTIRNTMLNWLTKLNYPKAHIPKIRRNFLGAAEIMEIALQYKDLGFQVEPETLEDATGVPIKRKEPKKKPTVPPNLLPKS